MKHFLLIISFLVQLNLCAQQIEKKPQIIVMTDGEIDAILDYREEEEKKEELKDIGWYKKAIWTNEDRIDPDLITTSSIHFEIRSAGLKGDLWKKITGMVERKREDSEVKFRILSRKVE